MAVKVTRRTFIRGAGVTIGSAAAGVGSTGLDRGPVQEAEAVAPVIIYGAALGATAIGLGWSLRDAEIIGKDDPPEGLTAGALHEDVDQTSRTRKSTNASTFVDNRNIIDGLEHSAYVEGKLAAIEQLNNQETQANVEAAAQDAIDAYFTTIQSNLLKSWNESCRELDNLVTAVNDHSDLTFGDVYKISEDIDYTTTDHNVHTGHSPYTLADGSTMELLTIKSPHNNSGYVEWNPPEKVDSTYTTSWCRIKLRIGGEDVYYLNKSDWGGIWNDIEAVRTTVSDGIILWVDSVYGDVQAGDIELSDLITPRERAAMMTDDEDYPQAVADLLALNVPVDFEREATVEIPAQGVTVRGTLGLTSPPAEPLTTGVTYSPGTFGTTYLTYDISTGEGTWSAYNEGIDGGVVTFTSEPHPKTLYQIDTAAGETVDATTGEFTDEGDGTWTVDLSGELDDAITSIEAVRFYSEVEDTQYETVQIEDDFTITSIENSDGEQVSEMEFSQDEPQDDTNYITQEEWDEMAKRNEELIEKYEEAAAGGGGAGLFPNGIVSWATNNPAKAVAGGGGIAAAWALLTA